MSNFYLNWQTNSIIKTGFDSVNYVNNAIVFNINYPGNLTESTLVSVSSSAQSNRTFNNLNNVKVYLTGDAISLKIVQEIWPSLGNGFYPQRLDLNGGFEISFDGGRNYSRFSTSLGYEKDSSTWIVLPAISIGINGADGVLGAFDTASFNVRFTIPPGAVEYQKLNIGLALDFDVI